MNLHVSFEIGTYVVLLALLIFDLVLVTKRPHAPSMREAGLWIGFYVSLAVVFGLIMWWSEGGRFAGEFFAGWLTEYSLSMDNLFIFIIILTQFKVPKQYQQAVLMFGILAAIVLRGIFIVVGAAAINNFAWVFYLFGLFLLFTALKLVKEQATEDHDDSYENGLTRALRKRMTITEDFEGVKLRTRLPSGKRAFTPMMVVFLAIASADVLFAVDSIPAIFGLTQEPFIVFTANIFALMGLRQLYFLLGGLVERLVYLSAGLAAILAFIGVKLIIHAMHENTLPFINGGAGIHAIPEVPIWLSLTVIIGVLAIATLASLWKTRSEEKAEVVTERYPADSGDSGQPVTGEATHSNSKIRAGEDSNPTGPTTT